ncbi:MAG: hypothetical protein EZS28_008929 [Streblomastix strix]|uniref:Uncharacterized protein n=1 Tax=Streblomastix strix TaxID=222440 RepID=A0A5J4WL01_9EUKA|nr:MAG: hypothetical protein EZS28_008929 [Streblomastix strix]
MNKQGALRWNEDIILPVQSGQISLRLKKLLDVMGIKGKQVYLFRHSAETRLVVLDLEETLINTFIGNVRNSRSVNDYHLFVERLKDYEIVTKLSDTHGLMELSYSFIITSPFVNLPRMPFCNIGKQVSELLTMVSNKQVSTRCQQQFMEGYAHAVR